MRKASTPSPFEKTENELPFRLVATPPKMQLTTFGTYIIVDLLFAVCGGILLIFALVTQSEITQTPTIDNVATDLLLNMCPLTGRQSTLGLGGWY